MKLSRCKRSVAFTLLELLVVLGLVATITAIFATALTQGGRTVALQTGQASLVNLVTTARARAVATNNDVRLLVRNDTAATDYRRLIVMVQLTNGVWLPVHSVWLPPGVYLLPYRTRVPAGMYPVAADWRTADGTNVLGSSALSRSPVVFVFNAGAEEWEYVGFKPAGTMETGTGSLIVAAGRARPPGEFATGESPVALLDAQAARGVQLSNYGVPRLIDDRSGF